VFVDEAIMASRAWGWLETGLNFGPLDAGVFEKRFEGYWTFNPVIPTWIHAAFIRCFGLSVISLRSASFLAGAVLLVAVHSITYQISGSRRCGFTAALLVASSFSFLFSSHLIRYDIFVAALGFGAIALYLFSRRMNVAVFSLLAGLLIGLAFEIHVNAAIYGPVLLTLYLNDDGLAFIRRRSFWVFSAGVSIALGWYLWLHVLRYPETYFGMGRAFAGTHFPPLLSRSFSVMLGALLEMWAYLLEFTGTRILATLIAILILWRKQRPVAKKPTIMLLTGSLTLALLVGNKMDYYAILITPFSDIILAVWIHQALRVNGMTTLGIRAGKVLAYSTVVISALLILVTVRSTPPPGDFRLVASRIKRALPDGGSVMGSQSYWFDLYRHPYLSWQQILAYQRYEADSTFDDAMESLRPDVLVIDNHMRLFIRPDQANIPASGFQRYVWDRRLRKEDIDAFLARRGKLVDTFNTATYGTVEIYVLRWEMPENTSP
jgi:4-amino-4-deoxy-L-arabinose transferase-like glycosyltransferase